MLPYLRQRIRVKFELIRASLLATVLVKANVKLN